MNFCNDSGLNTRVVCTYIASHNGSEGVSQRHDLRMPCHSSLQQSHPTIPQMNSRLLDEINMCA